MFDLFRGLPVHVLIVHAVVVLLPLMSVVTFVVALRRSWRQAAGWWVVAADLVVFLLALVARLSGRNLQLRLSALLGGPVAVQHGRAGMLVPWFALGVVIAAILVALVARSGPVLVGLAILLAGVTGAVAIGWTVYTGDLGARAVWERTIQSTKPPGG